MKSALCLSFSFALFALPTAHAAHLAGNAVDWSGRQVSPTVTSRVFRQVCVNNNGEVAYLATVATSSNQVNVLWSTGGLGRTGTPAGTHEIQTPAYPAVPGTVAVQDLEHFYLNNNGTLSVTGRSVLPHNPYFIRIGSTEVLRTTTTFNSPLFPARMRPATELVSFITPRFNCAFAEGTVAASITVAPSISWPWSGSYLMFRSLSGSNWERSNANLHGMMPFVAAAKNDAALGLLTGGVVGSQAVLFGLRTNAVLSPSPGTAGSYGMGVVSSGPGGNSAFVAQGGQTGPTLFKCNASRSMVSVTSAGQAIPGTTEILGSGQGVFSQLAMDTNGSLVYQALISSNGVGTRGLFRSAKGTNVSSLLLKTGATAPGVTNYLVDTINGVALADSGRLLVHARLKYNGTPPSNVPALKEVLCDTASSTGALRLFAEAGDTVTVDGQTKTITGFELGNVINRGVSISGLPINDSGMVACTLKFGNDRAVFVFDAK